MRHLMRLSVALACILAACSDPVEVERPSARVAGSDRVLIGRAPNIRDEFLLLNEAVPEFSGVFLDADGRLTVRVTNENRADTPVVREALAVFARMHGARDAAAGTIRFVRSELSYRAADSLLTELLNGPLANARITTWTVEDVSGKIRLTVAEPGDRASVEQLIPTAARRFVRVDVGGGLVSLQATLHDRSRPLDNAFQIRGRSAADEWCSAGYMVYRPSATQGGVADASLGRYMLTAAHCGQVGIADTTAYVQPAGVGSPRIGVEWRESITFIGDGNAPPACRSAFNSNSVVRQQCQCAFGAVCSYGDVSLVQLDDSVQFYFAYQTRARTVLLGNAAPDSLAYVSLVQSRVTPIAGQAIAKVGARTGLSAGQVTNSCVGMMPTQNYQYRQLCQIEASGRVGGGDSGAPVYLRGSTNAYSLAVGILHTGNLDYGVPGVNGLYNRYYFTPLGQVEQALQTGLVWY